VKWLEYQYFMTGRLGVGGSNPLAPTNKIRHFSHLLSRDVSQKTRLGSSWETICDRGRRIACPLHESRKAAGAGSACGLYRRARQRRLIKGGVRPAPHETIPGADETIFQSLRNSLEMNTS
jgi:hypothetical protein